MPGPSLRIVRRPKGARTLTAASQPISDPQQVFRSTMGTAVSATDWQTDCWDMYDQVGELRYYTGWRAASCSRARLIATDIDPDTGLPTGGTENQRVNDIVTAIADGALGQAQFIKRMVECLTIPGEVWVAIIARDGMMRWLALNREEIRRGSRGVEVELPEGGRHQLNMAADSLFRVWNPRPRRASEPDSPVRATLDPLHEIVRTTKTIANASKSRLIGNGIVFVPQEMQLPPINPPIPTPAGSPAAPIPEGLPAVQQLQELLWQVANTAYDDEDSMAALIPILATVPAEFIDKVQHLKFDNQVTDVAIKVRNDAIARLAMGLDVAPERLLGLGSQSNHWSAWQIADEDVQLHIAPVMETICQALNDQVLKTVFAREGIDPTRYMLWYDPSQLTADPDKTNNATAAFQAGAITAEAYRDFLGLGEDTGYDYTTLEGWQKWAQDHLSSKPELMVEDRMVALLGPIGEDLLALAPAAPPPGQLPPEPPPEQPAIGQEPNTETNPPPPEQQARVSPVRAAIVDLMVSRALELAGKRRRTHADHPRLRDIPMHQTHRYMPPVGESEVGKLIAGWDAALEDEVLARLGIDSDALRDEVRRAVRRQLTTQVVDA